MSLDLAGLSVYTEQNKLPLITKSQFAGKTLSMLTPQPGIKSSQAINILTTDAIFQDGASCGWHASGSTAPSQRILTVGQVKVQEGVCPADLNQYWLQTQLQAGSQPEREKIPFEQLFSELKADTIGSQLEVMAWQGDTGSASANLKRADGLLKIIDAATGVIDATPQASITSTTVRGIYKDIYTILPATLRDKPDVVSFCGWDVFATLVNKLTDDNLFHYNTDAGAAAGELMYPGTNMKIVAVHGLNGTNRIITARLSNLFYGFDMLNDEENFKIFYAEEAEEVRFSARFKAGFQIAFPTEIVSYQNS